LRLAIVGAGIVGVTTAYELAADGHEVTVYERRGGVAAEASHANAGVVAPGYVTPWAAPGMPLKVLRHLLQRHAPVRLGGWSALALAPWLWRWWRACRPQVWQANRQRMQRLAQFSRLRMDSLTQDLRLDHEQASGFLVLLRGERDLALARGGIKLLHEMGVPFELLDAARCRQVEPALNPGTPLRAGIHLARDGVGNCRQFAQLLRARAEGLGARFCFETPVARIDPGRRVRLGLGTAGKRGDEDFDGVVVCAGVDAGRLLVPLGLRLPLAPVYGCSVTAPLRLPDGMPDRGPRAALMDEKYKVAVSRLGQRVRVAGSAEIGGSLQRFHDGTLATLYRVLEDWFPGAARMAEAQRWKGARPMLPDGPPVLGASGRPGVWLNLGHGSSGWALSCGSARVLADLVGGRTPAIDIEGLGVERLSGSGS
jgi:D-amino-acid dehydrogenase